MAKEKFGVAVDEEIVGEVDELVAECDDLGAIVVHRRSGYLIRHASVRIVLSHRMSESVHPEVC